MTTRDLTALEAHMARIRAYLEGAGASTPPDVEDPPPADPDRVSALQAAFGLSDFERDALLLAAFAELESDGASLISDVQGDPRLELPTVGLALTVLPEAHWSAFSADGPLRYAELVHLGEGSATRRPLELPERVLHFLVGLNAPDELLLLLARPIEVPTVLSNTLHEVAVALAQRLEQPGVRSTPAVALCGPDPKRKASVAAAAAALHGMVALRLDADSVPADTRDRAQLARRWSREGRLNDVLLVVDASEVATPGETRQVASFVGQVDDHVVLLANEPLVPQHRTVMRIDVPRVPASEQHALWMAALGEAGERMNGAVDRVATHFSLDPATIDSIGADVRRAAAGDATDEALSAVIWTACREQGRPKLDELAQRIEGSAGWDAIVLPERELMTLRTLAAQVRQRAKVYDQWGFAKRGTRGLGINALFAGASGTGKTLAAEILGHALELDVYRIDLSSVVSKWIGETEKNLRRVFDAAEDGCAILLFDEADALFGKRSDVKDSHDRYANIEVSYLLQRMEAYRGLALLTTNLRSQIDDAFLRRIRFVVDFPFPDLEQRREIWRGIFPAATPTNGLDWERLAQLNVTGGNIRNIAVNAAFIAAEHGGAVEMDHIRSAARVEYEKLERHLTGAELQGWPRGGNHA